MKKSDLKQAPLIFISPNTEIKGDEFDDRAISLAETYQRAIFAAGGIPIAMPAMSSRELIAECVHRADGIVFTGGDDVDPRIYAKKKFPAAVQKTVVVEKGERDLRELILVDEIFKQHKPLLGICRGHQIVNVALGGTLIADIPLQVKKPLSHRQPLLKSSVVHEVRLTGQSMLAKITGKRVLGVNSTHHQAIGRLAAPLCASAFSEDGIVEAAELRPERVGLLPFFMTVQFHPERLAPRYAEHQALFNSFVRACAENRKR